MSSWAGVAAVSLFAVCASVWTSAVLEEVKGPYLDEYFHIRQAQAYCAGNWRKWDPKITTPPGLYVLSALLRSVFNIEATEENLRMESAVFGFVGIPIAIFVLISNSNYRRGLKGPSLGAVLHSAINVAFFPLLFFFSALYYTDVQSTFWVLVNHALAVYHTGRPEANQGPSLLRQLFIVSTGLLALSYRQTNIFWVAGFNGLIVVTRTLQRRGEAAKDLRTASVGDAMRRTQRSGLVYDPPAPNASLDEYVKVTLSLPIALLMNLKPVSKALLPYLLLAGSFCGFVYVNGGVVLGDKSNHEVSLHLAQMLYIWPGLFFFYLPYLLLDGWVLVQGTLERVYRPASRSSVSSDSTPRIIVTLVLLLAMTGVVHLFTLIHPFTLADNRHYAFYVFRYTIRRHALVKYALVPLYFATGQCALWALAGRRSPTTSNTISFILTWLACTTLSLVTAPLVEPRYFIIPLVFWRIYLPSPSSSPIKQTRYLWCETLWHLGINAVTGYIFLYKGFNWATEPGTQRFMW